jgi:hypothetical protein
MEHDPSAESEVQAHKACVVYHSATGEIRHVYQVIVYRGGLEPTQAEIEERALDLAKDRVHLPAQVLHVHPHHLKPGVSYKVHAESKSLVELPSRSPRRK